MSFYSADYLAKRRKKWLDSLTKVQYYENDSWKTATINSKTISGDELVILAYVPCAGASATITGVRVYDADGLLAGSATVSITHTDVQNTLLKFVLPIKEV